MINIIRTLLQINNSIRTQMFSIYYYARNVSFYNTERILAAPGFIILAPLSYFKPQQTLTFRTFFRLRSEQCLKVNEQKPLLFHIWQY